MYYRYTKDITELRPLLKKLNTDYKQLLRAWALMWQADSKLAVINIVLQILQALLPVVSLYFIKLLIDALTHHDKTYSEVIYVVAGFGIVQFLLALATQYSAYVSTIHQQKLTDHLAGEVLKKAIAVDYEYYENPAYHDTLHLAQQQSLYKASALLANFNMALLNSLSLLFLIGFFFTQHSLFAILFMVLSVPLAVIKWYSGHALMRIEREFVPLEREANYLHGTLTEVSFAKEVRVFGFGQSFIKKFNTIRSHIHHQKEKLHKKLTWYSLAAEAMEIVVMTIIFILLAKYTLTAAITVGAFVIYLQGFQRLQSTSKNFLQALVLIFQQRLFLNDLFTFFDIENKNETQNGVAFPNGNKGLAVQNLSFTYPQTQKPVLHNVSLNCERGQVIAIVGENGSGKSTLVKLLAGLYTLQSGQINIDDVAIADIEQSALRQNTIFLFQDFEKYFFTVEENIALCFAQSGQTPAHMEKAAILSGAHPFITRLSQQYKTRMGRVFEGSEQLSGGQWQKLALARVFYKNAQLVVLDEPTSALDVTAEFDLFKNIKEHLQHKMVILITHRLYNLKIADHIYVMDNGSIAQQGSFETLIAAEGIFRRMYEAQKL